MRDEPRLGPVGGFHEDVGLLDERRPFPIGRTPGTIRWALALPLALALGAGAVYQGGCFLGSALCRYVIARELVHVALVGLLNSPHQDG